MKGINILQAVLPDELPVEVWKCMGEMGRDGDRVFEKTVQQTICG